MVDKLAVVRLKNLAEALLRATAAAERIAEKNPGLLDPSLVSRLEDIEMEVGMALADAEDGSLLKRTG